MIKTTASIGEETVEVQGKSIAIKYTISAYLGKDQQLLLLLDGFTRQELRNLLEQELATKIEQGI